jgi:hypothetical protein
LPMTGGRSTALGRASLLLGRPDEAQMRARHALDLCRAPTGFAAHAHHLLGDVAAPPDHFNVGGREQLGMLSLEEPAQGQLRSNGTYLGVHT